MSRNLFRHTSVAQTRSRHLIERGCFFVLFFNSIKRSWKDECDCRKVSVSATEACVVILMIFFEGNSQPISLCVICVTAENTLFCAHSHRFNGSARRTCDNTWKKEVVIIGVNLYNEFKKSTEIYKNMLFITLTSKELHPSWTFLPCSVLQPTVKLWSSFGNIFS